MQVLNEYIGMSDFFELNPLIDIHGFNCYGYAIGNYNSRQNPGYYSKHLWNTATAEGLLNITIAKITAYTIEDLTELNMVAVESTLAESVDANSWKIAVRVDTHQDYHYMRLTNRSKNIWTSKAGGEGPVMILLNGNNPSTVSWDTYHMGDNSMCEIEQVGRYTSAIKYIIISGV